MITKFSRSVSYHVTCIERLILRYFSRMFEFTRGLCQVKHPFELLHSWIIWIEPEPKVSSWRSGSILHVDCGDLVRLVSKVEAVLNHDMWCCLHIHIFRKGTICRGRMQKGSLFCDNRGWDLYILVFYIFWPLWEDFSLSIILTNYPNYPFPIVF